jgi:hypothetical protein
MQLYLLIFALLLLISIISLFEEINKYYSIFIVVVLFLFGALRYKIGMDYESYEGIFDSIENVPMSFARSLELFIEPGYAIIVSYLKYFGFEKIGLFGIHILLSLYFTHKAILKYSNNVYISWLILFGVYYANLFFNGIRQGLFIAILFYYLPILLVRSNRNIIIILLMTFFLSFTLHKTALILPIIYFLCLINPNYEYKRIILVGSLIWAFTGLGNVLVQIGGLSFLKDTAYLSVVDFYSNSEAFGTEIKFFSITVLHRLAILVLALYFSNFNSASLLFKKLTNIYFWGIVIYFMLVPLGYMMATRINMNLKIFDVVLIPYFIVFLKEYKFKMIGLTIVALWSFAVMLTNFYIPGNYEYYVPYRSIFSKG